METFFLDLLVSLSAFCCFSRRRIANQLAIDEINTRLTKWFNEKINALWRSTKLFLAISLEFFHDNFLGFCASSKTFIDWWIRQQPRPVFFQLQAFSKWLKFVGNWSILLDTAQTNKREKKTAAVAWRRGKFFVVAPRSAAGAGSMPSVHSMEVSLIGKINPAADAERPRLWRWMRRMIKSNATEMDDAVNCIGPPREAHERK